MTHSRFWVRSSGNGRMSNVTQPNPTSKTKVNHCRLAALALGAWVLVTCWVYLPRVESSYADAKHLAQRQRDDLTKAEFFKCAASNGVDSFSVANHYLRCKEEQSLNCANRYLCDSDLLIDSCVRERVPKCSNAGYLEFNGLLDAKAYNADIRKKNIMFYLQSWYGHTLFEFIGILLAPVILLILHRVAGRHLWRWLTSGHKT